MAQTYLSWDVGIANLAYCLIEKTDELNFKIKKWDVINLKEPDNLCLFLDKNKVCNKKALYYSENHNITYYCKKHSSNYKQSIIKEEPCIQPSKCVHIIKNKTQDTKICNKVALNYLVNQTDTYCKQHMATYIKNIQNMNSLKKISKSNANKIPMNILAGKLFSILNSIPELLEVAEVLIENQPTLKNPTMKTISSLLFSYFILKGITDKQHNKISQVKFICPSNKLKVSSSATNKLKKLKNKINVENTEITDNKDILEDIQTKQKTKQNREIYILTKKLGVKFCKELIKDDLHSLELINKTNKQDDLCDAFLQAYYYLFCKVKIPDNIKTILNKLSEEEDPNINTKALDITGLY